MDVGCTLPVGGQFKKLDCNQEGLNLETRDLCVCVCMAWMVVEFSGLHAQSPRSPGQDPLPWSAGREGLFCPLGTAQPHLRGSFPGYLS